MKKTSSISTSILTLITVLIAILFQTNCAHKKSPLIIGHRGASGVLPDHTLESYREAIRQGADVIEPDLVMTKDGVLICRHENELSETTNVRLIFPKKKTTKVIDGQKVTGWFSEDLTFDEVKRLRANQPLPFRDQSHNGKYQIPSFDEVLEMIQKESATGKRPIGVYPETKHPSYFQSLNLPLEEALLRSLKNAGFDHNKNPVFIQSFEIENLKALRRSQDFQKKYKIIQLLGGPDDSPFDAPPAKTYGQMVTREGLLEISSYADGIGPWKRLLLPESPDKVLQPATNLVHEAHKLKLLVHPYTFRNENHFLSPSYQGDPLLEYDDFYSLGVDGVFTDFPDSAVRARSIWLSK